MQYPTCSTSVSHPSALSSALSSAVLPYPDTLSASLAALYDSLPTAPVVSFEDRPPVNNMGGNPDYYPCHIDALGFSISGNYFKHDIAAARLCLERWSNGLFTIGGRLEQRYNGYPECWGIIPVNGSEAPFLGFVGISVVTDNMRGRWFFSLPGLAASAVADWSALVSDMVETDGDGRITRCDFALDDLLGNHPLSECEALYDAGLFGSNGRPPNARMITHKQGTAGDTFYVGSRQSGKLFRCYEKGKQLGDANSTWVRYELELLHKDRVIPWEALLLPLQYLKGSYPKAFSWMAATSRCIKTVKESARITFERMQRFAKQQCGRLVRYMRDVAGMDESEIVGVLSADIGRYPLRLWDAARDSVLPWSTANRVSSPLPAF